MRKAILFLFIIFSFLVLQGNCTQLVIVATGNTHGALYSCGVCPSTKAGGLARRATLINKLRKKYKNILLLDSGKNFAGGVFDEFNQTASLNLKRSYYLSKVLGFLNYDALCLGEEEFNFGRKFLVDVIKENHLNVVASNIKNMPLNSYILKKIEKIPIFILGYVEKQVKNKEPSLEMIDFDSYFSNFVENLNTQGKHLVILLSSCDDAVLKSFLDKHSQDVPIVISSTWDLSLPPFEKYKKTLILRPAFQGKSLRLLHLEIENSEIKNYRFEEVQIKKEITPHQKIKDMLPRCFRNEDCARGGLYGECKNPGTLTSFCQYYEAQKINCKVIIPKKCVSCNMTAGEDLLKRFILGLDCTRISSDTPLANSLIKEFNVELLPAYFIEKSVQKDKGFRRVAMFLKEGKDYFYVKPTFVGGTFFVNRKSIPWRIDVFFSPFGRNSLHLVELLRGLIKKASQLHLEIHFLAQEEKNGFQTLSGKSYELEEILRCLCIKELYSYSKLLEYLSFRLKDIYSTWWQDPLMKAKLDVDKIKKCAQSKEILNSLRKNTELNRELNILLGPYILLENQEIFGISKHTKVEDILNIIKKRRR